MGIAEKVDLALNNIRPYLEADGGNVKVLEVTGDMIVKLELEGNCVTCPMSVMTMKAGIEDTIKKAFPEIKSVEAVNV
ncbi:MAG: NifU family protein [Cytophagales bacterium]|nr:NifU family protein [Cytophagales bacterium]